MIRFVWVFVVLLCGSVICQAQKYKDPAAPVEERVEDLLSRMTLDEKIAQMGMIRLDEAGKKGLNGIGACESPFIKALPEYRLFRNVFSVTVPVWEYHRYRSQNVCMVFCLMVRPFFPRLLPREVPGIQN